MADATQTFLTAGMPPLTVRGGFLANNAHPNDLPRACRDTSTCRRLQLAVPSDEQDYPLGPLLSHVLFLAGLTRRYTGSVLLRALRTYAPLLIGGMS